MNCKIDDFSRLIAEELARYNSEVSKVVKDIITEEANKTVENLQEASPKRHKKIKSRVLNRYSKGWKVKKLYENKYNISLTVHNKTDYQLTHLLEDGFATRDGGRVEGKPHIKPVEEKMIEELEDKIEKAVTGI